MILDKPQITKQKVDRAPQLSSLGASKPLLWHAIFGLLLAGLPLQPRTGQTAPLGEAEEALLPAPPLREQAGMTGAHNLPFPDQKLPSLEELSTLRRVTHRIQAGDTLSKLLVRFGVSEQEWKLWLQSIQKHLPLSAFRSGKEVQFYFSPPPPAMEGQKGKETLKALELDLNEDSILTWEKGTQGIVFSKRDKPYDIELRTAGGVVERSLFEDAARAGLNQGLLSQLADIFAWEIDFDREIQKGDSFKVLYEERSRKGSKNPPSFRILAVEMINASRTHSAIYFETERGKGSYYDLDGRSLARPVLRFPLEFTSITSTFSHSRLHPILKVDRPHHGVDFAAKLGTPVRAIGDGTILYAGWRRGGYGRMIEIEHDPVYSSRYAHLQRVAQGIHNGVKVRKGQIIGYVGSSGLSTGAHLHFELYKDANYIDALNFEFPAEDRIEPALLRLFENRKQLLLAKLAATPAS